MATQTEVLNLDGVSQRTEGARFVLVDTDDNDLGAIVSQTTAVIDNRADGALKRSIGSFVLAPSDAAAINPLADRVKVYFTIDAVDYPLGVFLFASWSGRRYSYGVTATTRLLDKGTLLGEPIATSIGFSSNKLIRDAIAEVFHAAGVHTFVIDPASTATIDQPIGWFAGSNTTHAFIASYLCKLAGLTDWYFDNTGLLTVDPIPNLSSEATLVYAAGSSGRIIAGSAVEQNSLLEAPNRFIAVNTASRDAAIVGVYDLPNTAPHSIENRNGRVITKTIPAPGVASELAALAFAESYARTDPATYATVSFSGPPDPRHDTFDVVSYLGSNYVEVGWRLRCAPGGPHEHSLIQGWI